MEERKTISLHFHPNFREIIETIASDQNFFQPTFISDHKLSYNQSGIPLSSYIMNASHDELIFIFMSLGLKSLETLNQIQNIKNFGINIDFSLKNIFYIPENKYLIFSLPQISDSRNEDLTQSALFQIGTALIDINNKIIPLEKRDHSYRKKPFSFKQCIYKICNSTSNEIQNLIEIFKTHKIQSIYSCVFCKENWEIINNEIVKMDSEHHTHLKCFSENMVVPILEAKSLIQIYCKRQGNEAHQDCDYNTEGSCSISRKHSLVKCFCDKSYHKFCEESNNKECKFPSLEQKCKCSKQDPCDQCIFLCGHELIDPSFIKKNKDQLPFTILRKYQILMLKEHYHPAECEKCKHKECIKYIDSDSLKPYKKKLSCKHKICSFCLSLECSGKRCSNFKEFLNTSGMVKQEPFPYVYQDLII